MGDMAEGFRAMDAEKTKRRASNAANSTALLKSNGITFVSKREGVHLIVGVGRDYDFWPSTGLWIHRDTGKRGRGVFNLIKRLKKEHEPIRVEG